MLRRMALVSVGSAASGLDDSCSERTGLIRPALGDNRGRLELTHAQLAKPQDLVTYWGTDYDWRKFDAMLNALPQLVTNLDGLDIHLPWQLAACASDAAR